MSKRKNPATDENSNADFCDFLMELAEYEKNVSRNIHKYNAYRKAASVLANQHKRIESGDEAKKLNGIGEKIAKKIDEYLQTGKLRKLENIQQDGDAQAIALLTRVSGIGPVKAADFVRNGIKTIDILKTSRKRFPETKYKRLSKLKNLVSELDSQFTLTICGSYRRGKQQSGDIDALVTHPTLKINTEKNKQDQKLMLKNLVNALSGFVTDVISLGDTKFMGVCRLSSELPARRLDIRLLPCEQYHCAVLYFTGSDVFNKTMRAHALEKGFTLNEYALRPIGETGVPGEPVPITSEEEIFDYIEYPYRVPEERNM